MVLSFVMDLLLIGAIFIEFARRWIRVREHRIL